MRFYLLCLLPAIPALCAGPHPSAESYLWLSGDHSYVEIPSAPDLSFGSDGFTVSTWLKPDTLEFRKTEGSGYVYFAGKGERRRQEWAMRMYSRTNREKPPRPNRISFYLFNPPGGLGEGSYVQQPVRASEWIQITAVAWNGETAIYRDGEYIRCDEYDGPTGHGCHAHFERIQPVPGNAPLRLGTRNFDSFFEGGLAGFRIWNRALGPAEIRDLFRTGTASRDQLAAEFLLNQASGNVAHDTTGRHTGKIVRGEWRTR